MLHQPLQKTTLNLRNSLVILYEDSNTAESMSRERVEQFLRV